MKGLNTELAVADALVAADYLRTLDGANGKVGAVGYCLGGKLAFLLAMKPETDAAVSYYGVAIQARLDQIDEVRRSEERRVGQSVSVRVDLGGLRNITKKKQYKT